jgi:hypothetical protein
LEGSASLVAAASRMAFGIILLSEVTDLHQIMHNQLHNWKGKEAHIMTRIIYKYHVPSSCKWTVFHVRNHSEDLRGCPSIGHNVFLSTASQ